MTKIKVATYLRVSTDAQSNDDRYGVQVQREDVQYLCDKNDYEIVREYFDDGVSGSKLSRPALDQMLIDCKSGEFDIVVVPKLDRLARDLFAQLFIYKDLQINKIDLMSVAEPMVFNTPSGQLYMQIVGAFAEFERSRITERLTGGRMHKAKEGKYSGGRPALGYISDAANKALIIDLHKADIIIKVFKMREDGLSYNKIAELLNEEGLTSSQNKPFRAMQVKRIIDRRSLYEGMYKYSTSEETQGTHGAIL